MDLLEVMSSIVAQKDQSKMKQSHPSELSITVLKKAVKMNNRLKYIRRNLHLSYCCKDEDFFHYLKYIAVLQKQK